MHRILGKFWEDQNIYVPMIGILTFNVFFKELPRAMAVVFSI